MSKKVLLVLIDNMFKNKRRYRYLSSMAPSVQVLRHQSGGVGLQCELTMLTHRGGGDQDLGKHANKILHNGKYDHFYQKCLDV